MSLEELCQALLAFDVVRLFPAIKSKSTGEIVRKMVVKSGIEVWALNSENQHPEQWSKKKAVQYQPSEGGQE